jgi:hypothetical protein
MSSPAGRIAVTLLALAWAEEAAALEYCVSCEGPAAMYRCVVEGTPDGPGQDPGTSLYCISELAAKGRHESCSVARGAPFPCPGFTTVVAAPSTPTMAPPPPAAGASGDVPPVASPAEPAAPGELATPPETAEQPAKVPRTVEELAGQTMKSSKEGLEKAGEAIGGTAKKAGEQIGNAGSAIGNAASKTWSCITSLFSSCGGEEADAPPPPADPPPN